MKSMKVLMILVVLTMASINIASTLGEASPPFEAKQEVDDHDTPNISLRATSRVHSHDGVLKYRPRPRTCHNRHHRRICHARDSPGHNCCNNRCVNLKSDRFNCGRCGMRCGYSEICCNGKCVNPMFHTRHCGGCFNSCTNGNSCFYGMCGYA